MKPDRKNEEYIYKIASKNVKKYRELKGLTQEELAELIPYSYSTVISIEGNYRNNFSLAVINSIANALNVKIYFFFMDDDDLEEYHKITNK